MSRWPSFAQRGQRLPYAIGFASLIYLLLILIIQFI
jgi:hypothetical protein